MPSGDRTPFFFPPRKTNPTPLDRSTCDFRCYRQARDISWREKKNIREHGTQQRLVLVREGRGVIDRVRRSRAQGSTHSLTLEARRGGPRADEACFGRGSWPRLLIWNNRTNSGCPPCDAGGGKREDSSRATREGPSAGTAAPCRGAVHRGLPLHQACLRPWSRGRDGNPARGELAVPYTRTPLMSLSHFHSR